MNPQFLIYTILVVILIAIIAIFILKKYWFSWIGNLAKKKRVEENLEKILRFLQENEYITNDKVQELTNVGDAMATIYLNMLEKRERIEQIGRTGKYVKYRLK